jgi:hypothetical protein
MKILLKSSTLHKTGIQIVSSGYKNNPGLYAKAVISTDSQYKLLLGLCEHLNPPYELNCLKEDPHITLMYSKDVYPQKFDNSIIGTVQPFSVQLHKVEHWMGHDNDGYVCCSVVCPTLHYIHNRLSEVAKHSYFPFKPHFTIAKNMGQCTPTIAKNVRNLNMVLQNSPMSLNIESIHILNLKKPKIR